MEETPIEIPGSPSDGFVAIPQPKPADGPVIFDGRNRTVSRPPVAERDKSMRQRLREAAELNRMMERHILTLRVANDALRWKFHVPFEAIDPITREYLEAYQRAFEAENAKRSASKLPALQPGETIDVPADPVAPVEASNTPEPQADLSVQPSPGS